MFYYIKNSILLMLFSTAFAYAGKLPKEFNEFNEQMVLCPLGLMCGCTAKNPSAMGQHLETHVPFRFCHLCNKRLTLANCANHYTTCHKIQRPDPIAIKQNGIIKGIFEWLQGCYNSQPPRLLPILTAQEQAERQNAKKRNKRAKKPNVCIFENDLTTQRVVGLYCYEHRTDVNLVTKTATLLLDTNNATNLITNLSVLPLTEEPLTEPHQVDALMLPIVQILMTQMA